MYIPFSKIHKFDGKDHDGVELKLDQLSGNDITEAFRQYTAAGNFSAVLSLDPNYTIILAALAAKQPQEFFTELSAPDLMKVHQSVQNFLMGAGSEEKTPQAKSGKRASSSADKQEQV